ncbi:aspartate/glutamate racemase family protein [Alcaligenaceae bacterium CGII-47]|nr:aspartate/glutamate racemase family protein [Alcaligenaceae bacterium CGII-47]
MSNGKQEIRIGQLYPSGGIRDDEMRKMAPPDIRFITTRLPFKKTDLASGASLSDKLGYHAGLLADAQVSLIAFNCTSGSMISGPDEINRQIHKATGIPSVTTIEAVMQAIRATRMRRLILMTPYPSEVVQAEIRFLSAHGHEVVKAIGIPCEDPVSQGLIPGQTWVDLAHSVKDIECDGLLASCAGIQLADVIQTIENDFGRPVVASNQALLWACLQRLQVTTRPMAYGALLRGDFDNNYQADKTDAV